MSSLVSVLCLCYNHAPFLRPALDSVLTQTYPNLEIIVVDDVSTDASVQVIEEYVWKFPQIKFIRHTRNVGNCASFNEALAASSGEFVIDFATDDVLHPERVARQVTAFQHLPASFGVVYTDAEMVDEKGNSLGNFYRRTSSGQLIPTPAQGQVFADVLRRYFICPPTMMIRREVLEQLGGYDSSLAYEDFDFWVRSARHWKYHFLDQVLCQRRIHPHSLSRKAYSKEDRQLASTITVIRKAQNLVSSLEEKDALKERVKYEARHAYFTGNYDEALELLAILASEDGLTLPYKVVGILARHQVPLAFLRTAYHRLRYGRSGS